MTNAPTAAEQAIRAFEIANRHAALAATANRRGYTQEAWERRSYARFYRTVAVSYLAEANPAGYARMIVNRALSGSRR